MTRSPQRKRGAGATRHLACVLLISVHAAAARGAETAEHERPAAAIANAKVVANEQPSASLAEPPASRSFVAAHELGSLALEEDGRRRLSYAELEKLTASDGTAGHSFGRSVAIDGNTVVIGAPGAGTGGAVYVLRTSDGGNTYAEVDLLTASDGAAGDNFGYAVAVKGDTVMIGAPDKGANSMGAVYMFSTTDYATYTEVDILTADDAAAGDELRFGWAVAIDGDVVAISAYKQNAAYIFRAIGSCYDSTSYQVTCNVAEADCAGTYLAAGYISNGCCLCDLNCDHSLETAAAGTCNYAATDGRNTYGQVAKLTASDAGSNDKFAYSLDISGGVVAIGAMANEGAVYVFRTSHGPRRN